MLERNVGWLVGVLALAMVIGFVPLGATVNPLDDDAGSGMDAGDGEDDALPITPGSYEGTLTNPVDTTDRYAFEADGGQVLRFAWENLDDGVNIVRVHAPDGRTYVHDLRDENPFRSPEEETILHENGTWQLSFEVKDTAAGPTDYAFEFSILEPSARALAAGPAGPAGVVEASFDTPTDVTVQGWVSSAVNATDALAGRWTATFDGVANVGTPEEQPSQGTVGFFIYNSGTGTEIQITDGPEHDPEITLEEGADGIEWINGRLFLTDFVGVIHSVSYRTTSDADTMVGVWADDGVAAGGSSDDIVIWTNADVPAETKATVPGASVVGPFERTIELDPSFNGVFTTTGSAVATTDRSGHAEDPDGTKHSPSFGSTLVLEEPAPGPWTFHVNGTSVGTGSRTFLTGAFTPDLGIWNGVIDDTET